MHSGETRILYLGSRNQYQTIVDAKFYHELAKWKWTFKVSSRRYAGHVYGRRCVWRGGRKVTLLLSHEVLRLAGKVRPSAVHTADHKNNNTLDDREANLIWATKLEQSRNQTRYKNAA
jgi:hypothetical protein